MSETIKTAIIAILFLALGFGGAYVLPGSSFINGNMAGDALDRAEVTQIVEDYIATHPEHIIASLQSLQQRSAQKQEQEMTAAVKNNLAAIRNDDSSPSVGGEDSDIVLVEFFDYRCGYCKRLAGTVKKVLEAHPDIKFVFKEYPILSDGSRKAAQASLALYYLAPEKYLDFHMTLMDHQGEYTQEALNEYASQQGVDVAKFEEMMSNERVLTEIAKVSDLAEAISVRGTPALVIGEELIPGAVPFDVIDEKIKALKN